MSNLMADFLTNFNAIFRGSTTIVPAAQAAGAAVPNVEINKSISASTSASNAQAESLLAELRRAKESRDKQAAIEETQLGQNGVDDVDDVELERSSSIPRLTELLPYTAYIASQKIFVLEAHNAKGVESPEALGFAFELQPLSGMSDEVISIFSSIVETAPTGSCMQLSLMGSNDLSLYTKQYIEMREPGMFRTLAARRMEHFEHSSVNAPFSSEPYLLRQFRLVLSATMPCKNPEEPVKIEQVVRWRDQIASVLKSIHMYSSDWDADDLVQFASLLCNPQQMFMPGSAVKPQYDPGLRVRALIVKPSTAVIPSDDGQQLGFSDEHNSCVVRSFSVRNYPLEYSAFDTSSLIGDFNQTSRAFSCPFLITVGWRKNDFEARKNVVQIKAARATQQIESPLARFMPEIADKKRDWDILQESFTNGAGDVQLFHQVTLFCTANSIIEAEENAKAVWRSRGFELTNDVYLGMQSFLVVLPMGLTPAMASDLRAMDRLSTKTVDNVIHTAPICVDWAGVGKPVIALAGRRGQVGGVDIFDGTQTNYNAAVAGASGSGKSVFCNELLINYQGTGARCWVIDVGGSYEKLCQRLGGQIIRFGSETQLSLNPFPMVKNLDEDMEVLQPLVAQMAAGTRGDVSALQNAAIGKAIRLVWQERGPEMTITDLRDEIGRAHV